MPVHSNHYISTLSLSATFPPQHAFIPYNVHCDKTVDLLQHFDWTTWTVLAPGCDEVVFVGC
jgi:hypothetical protein